MVKIKKSATETGELLTMVAGLVIFNRFIAESDPPIIAGSIGVGTVLLNESPKVLSSLLPNFITDSIKRISSDSVIEQNNQLQNALSNAYDNTFDLIERDLFQNLELKESILEKFSKWFDANYTDKHYLRDQFKKFFIPSLKLYFTSANSINQFIDENGFFELDKFIERAFSESGKLLFPDQEMINVEDLIAFVKLGFARHFPISFTK